MYGWLERLAGAYHDVYNGQKEGKMMFGMRDYYALLKLLRRKMVDVKARFGLTSEVLTLTVSRNFGGKASMLKWANKIFHMKCLGFPPAGGPPPVRTLIADSLRDVAARHLMLFTRDSAALDLLVGARLVDPAECTVMVGSSFKDDSAELELIQQINQVRHTMAAGRTLILVNHFNIFEALYDLLNMKYVYKTGKDMKKIRMLRLAIGSRSQLCRVAEGFKVIVVVEESVRSELDLPLLNRFERQLLRPADMLTRFHQPLLGRVKEWMEQILAETALPSITSVFSCFHEHSLSSAVLLACDYEVEPPEGPEAEELLLQRIKRWFSMVAQPSAVMFSPSLRDVLPADDYFSRHDTFVSAINAYCLGPDIARDTLSVVMTHSTVAQLPADDLSGLLDVNTEVVRLASFSGEKHLVSAVETFYKHRGDEPRLFVLQCDSLETRKTLILHAMWIIVKEQAVRQQRIAARQTQGNPHSGQVPLRHVVVAMHLPPSFKERKRFFSLNFQPSWQYVFVDDVRGARKISTSRLLKSPLHELVGSGGEDLILDGEVSIKRFIHRNLISALARSAPSLLAPADEASSNYARITMVRGLLNHPPFEDLVIRAILGLLQSHARHRTAPLPLHVELATLVSAGTLYESLLLAMETVVTRALSFVIRCLDEDSGLALFSRFLHAQDAAGVALWLHLASHPAVISVERLGATCGLEKSVTYVAVHNGAHGAEAPTFPFAARVIASLDSGDTKTALMAAESGGRARMQQLCASQFGEETLQLWAAFADRARHVQYLHDYVSYAVQPFAGLDLPSQIELYSGVITAASADALSSPVHIHWECWRNNVRLYSICRLLSAVGVTSPTGRAITTEVSRLAARKEEGEVSAASVDRGVLEICLGHLWSSALEGWERPEAWVREFLGLRPFLEELLALLPKNGDEVVAERAVDSKGSLLAQHTSLCFLSLLHEEALMHGAAVKQTSALMLCLQHTDLRTARGLPAVLPCILEACGESTDTWQAVAGRYFCDFVGLDEQLTFDKYAGVIKELLYRGTLTVTGKAYAVSPTVVRRVFAGLEVQHGDAITWLFPTDDAAVEVTNDTVQAVALALKWQQDITSAASKHKISSAEVDMLRQSVGKIVDVPFYTATVEKAQRVLRGFVRRVMNAPTHQKLQPPTAQLQKLLETPRSRSFVLMETLRRQGLDGVPKLCLAMPQLAISGPEVEQAASASSGGILTEPFSWLGHDLLTSLKGAAIQCLVACDSSDLAECHQNSAVDDGQFLAALLGAIYVNWTQAPVKNPPGQDHLLTWLQERPRKDRRHGPYISAMFIWATSGFPDPVMPETRRKYSSATSTKRETEPGPDDIPVEDEETTRSVLQQNTVFSLCLVLSDPGNWFGSLLGRASDLESAYWPAMPDNEMGMILSASPYVGWYRCPKVRQPCS